MDNLLLKFFKNEEYAGWKNIALNLLRDGHCVFPGEKSIFPDQINKFITIKPCKEVIGCSVYLLDKEAFLKSELFFDEAQKELNNLKQKRIELLNQVREIKLSIKKIIPYLPKQVFYKPTNLKIGDLVFKRHKRGYKELGIVSELLLNPNDNFNPSFKIEGNTKSMYNINTIRCKANKHN